MTGVLGKIFGAGIGEIIKPIGDIIDNVTTNKEEKAKAQAEIEKILTDKLTRMEELSNQVIVAYLQDVADARSLQKTAIGSTDKFVRRFVYYFIIAWSLFSMAFLIAVTFFPIPAESIRFADTILGFLLGTGIASVFNFMVGSTRGSEKKNETISDLAKKSDASS